jgi:hypothetical protein
MGVNDEQETPYVPPTDKPVVFITSRAIKKDSGLAGIVRGKLIHGHMRMVGICSNFCKGKKGYVLQGKPFFYGSQIDLIENFNHEMPAYIDLDEGDNHKNAFRIDKMAMRRRQIVAYRDRKSGKLVNKELAYYRIPADVFVCRKNLVRMLTREMSAHLDDIVESSVPLKNFKNGQLTQYPAAFAEQAIKAGELYMLKDYLYYSLDLKEGSYEPVKWL